MFCFIGEIDNEFKKKLMLGNKCWDVFCPKNEKIGILCGMGKQFK
jgi:hypothetical protein